MDLKENNRYWEENAEAWTQMARQGYDVYRNLVNTPAFLSMLPSVENLRGLDVGCGEGYNTRKVAQMGAKMTAIDVSPTFIRHARDMEIAEPHGIEYHECCATELPFERNSFDFAIATMSLMDVPDFRAVLKQLNRVLVVGGFLQFSILHPCFVTRRFKWVVDESGEYGLKGETLGALVGDYFEKDHGSPVGPYFVEEWTFSAAPSEVSEAYPKFRVPRYFHTLSEWMNGLVEEGFQLEKLNEPTIEDERVLREYPALVNLKKIAFLLHVRCRNGKR